MATSPKPRREKSTTYTVPERSSQEELDRLLIHDRMFTSALGGVLPEQSDPARLQSVLDIGCGPGGWLLEMARVYPTIENLCGVDINEKMLAYARNQASVQQVAIRVQFLQMDALRQLCFPDASFDLVNERFGTSWLRVWEWPNFLQECQRVVRPGGIIRITEFNVCVESTSQALIELGNITIDAFYQSGHLASPVSDGLLKELPRILRTYGLENVQTRAHLIEYRAGTHEGRLFVEDWKRLFHNVEPFLRKWARVPENYEELYQQMLFDMEQPGFSATSRPWTVWGTRAEHFKLPALR